MSMIKRLVQKRDGHIQEFDGTKIINAIKKAFKDVYKNDSIILAHLDLFTQRVVDTISFECDKHVNNTISIEEIQDLVENALMDSKQYEVAKAYIKYRYLHQLARDYKDNSFKSIIEERINAQNVANQNANVDEASFGGRIGETADNILKMYALKYLISDRFIKNHTENRVYIHDLGQYVVGTHNCLSIPFDNLLKKGFNTRQVDIRPAHSLNTAFQLVAVIFQLQSLQQFGGVSSTHLDWSMVPYFRMSFAKYYHKYLAYELNREETKFSEGDYNAAREISLSFYRNSDNEKNTKIFNMALKDTLYELDKAVEGMYHNLNSLQSRSGNQLPFTSINYGTCTSEEGRYIIRALLNGALNGVGKFHKTSVFPCGIFQVGKGINLYPEDPNYDLFKLALECTSKRLYPNYVNMDWSNWKGYNKDNPQEFPSTMGCRTATSFDINGLGHLKDGRGNCAPSTIILPTIAMESIIDARDNNKDVIETFFAHLDQAITDCIDGLLERYKHICSQSPASARFMYENNTMYGFDGESIESAMRHQSLAVGQLGLAECLQLLIKSDHTSQEGMELAKRIEGLYSKRCKDAKEHYKLNFGVYYTPAENLCHTALKKFRDKYGVIPNVSDKDFFTNSMHVPVWKSMTPFEKIDIESQLTGFSTAGCITYIELESAASNNPEAMEVLVKYAMEHDIPYFAINVPNDTCNSCGFSEGELPDICPQCGSKDIQRLRRVTGYLTSNYKTAFNKGKIDETDRRVKHTNKVILE